MDRPFMARVQNLPKHKYWSDIDITRKSLFTVIPPCGNDDCVPFPQTDSVDYIIIIIPRTLDPSPTLPPFGVCVCLCKYNTIKISPLSIPSPEKSIIILFFTIECSI